MDMQNRPADALRPVNIQTEFTATRGGSVLITCGNTKVLCTALLEKGTMPFLEGTGKGWLTAEYAMLPSSTGARKKRDGIKKDGRSTEIQRLIGRCLRQALDMSKLGENVIYIDCDVLQADGGTRTASITGGYAALATGIDKWLREGLLTESPLVHQVAAVSVGIVNEEPVLDLCYAQDSHAQVDMNIVMNENGDFIEIQGNGEGRAFTPEELSRLLTLGKKGITELMAAQDLAIGK